MSDLMVFDVVKMNSLEIAKLVGCRHENIKRSIKRLAERGAIRQPPMGFIERINNLGFTVKDEVYVFEGEQGKRDSIIVVAQNYPELMVRIVDRWQELENAVRQNAVPNYGNTQIGNVLAFAETADPMPRDQNPWHTGYIVKKPA